MNQGSGISIFLWKKTNALLMEKTEISKGCPMTVGTLTGVENMTFN